MMKLGIVILNYKNYQETFNCVDSIKSTINGVSYKIYVVDNCSPNESKEELSKRYSDDDLVELILNDINGGFSAGNNVGLKKAVLDGCENILCTNPDVVFKDGAIEIMLDCLKNDKDLAVVGPKVYKADGSIQNANKGVLTPLTFVLRRRAFRFLDWFKLEKKYTYYGYGYKKPLFPKGMVSGCCFMIKSSVIHEIGYLDEKVFLYHEEDILGAKLRNHGYKVMLEPTAEIIHKEGTSTGGTSAFTRYHTFYSGLYYLWQYSGCSKFSFNFAYFSIKLLLGVYALKNKEYKCFYKKIKEEVRELKKLKRRT